MGYKERLAKQKIERRLHTLPVERHRCDKYPCSDVTCQHHRTSLEQELNQAFHDILKAKLPQGTRALVEGGHGYMDVRVVCGGCIPITCHFCVLKPGHEGQCFSVTKGRVNFTPEHY